MGDFDEEGKIILGLFLTCLLEAVQGRQEFQVVQVYLNRFLKVHEDVLAQDTVLLERVVELHTAQQQAWEHLQSLLLNSMCLVQHFSNIQM
jgi:U3 small nucleolar RNA-associated protein 21